MPLSYSDPLRFLPIPRPSNMEATLPSDPLASTPQGHQSLLGELTLIYLTLAYETDQELDEAEMEAITARIGEWISDTDQRDVNDIVQRAMTTYVQETEQRVYAEAVDAVGRAVPERQQQALLADLRCVAEADGEICDAQRRVIRDLARAWGLEIIEEGRNQGP